MPRRPPHPGYIHVFSQGGDEGDLIKWLVDHENYNSDSFGILATFDNEPEAQLYAESWRLAHPVPEGFADE